MEFVTHFKNGANLKRQMGGGIFLKMLFLTVMFCMVATASKAQYGQTKGTTTYKDNYGRTTGTATSRTDVFGNTTTTIKK